MYVSVFITKVYPFSTVKLRLNPENITFEISCTLLNSLKPPELGQELKLLCHNNCIPPPTKDVAVHIRLIYVTHLLDFEGIQ